MEWVRILDAKVHRVPGIPCQTGLPGADEGLFVSHRDFIHSRRVGRWALFKQTFAENIIDLVRVQCDRLQVQRNAIGFILQFLEASCEQLAPRLVRGTQIGEHKANTSKLPFAYGSEEVG